MTTAETLQPDKSYSNLILDGNFSSPFGKSTWKSVSPTASTNSTTLADVKNQVYTFSLSDLSARDTNDITDENAEEKSSLINEPLPPSEEGCGHPATGELPPMPEPSSRKQSITFQTPEELLQNETANTLIRLLTKCHIDKEYVPVREKRLLFESLSRFSFSVDNLKKRIASSHSQKENEQMVKFHSMHDLRQSPIPVKVMKQHFENLRK